MTKTLAAISIVALGAAVAPASAAVVGYYRFEDSTTLGKSTGTTFDLTPSTASVAPAQVATPFPNPVPGNGLTNQFAVDVNGDYFTAADTGSGSPLDFQDFTIEAFVQADTFGGTSNTSFNTVAGQYDINGSGRKWRFAAGGVTTSTSTTRPLVMNLSSTGTAGATIQSPYSLTTGRNYYIAASVDIESAGSSITFYLEDLSPSPAIAGLQSQTVSFINPSGFVSATGLNDSNVDFRVGSSLSSGAVTADWDGRLDEVRLSDTALASSDLLIVPEPTSLALLSLAALPLLRRRRT